VINQTMANQFFRDSRPLGRQFRLEAHGGAANSYEVVGVVADTKYQSIDEEKSAIVYLPLSQAVEESAAFNLRYQLRSDGEPTALSSRVADVIAAIHPRISVRFSTLSDRVAVSLSRPRLLAVLAGCFGAISLLLAMIGLYGTLAYQVNSRRNEIGVRLALGAGRTRVLGFVVGEAGRMASVGIAIGITVALASSRFLASFLYDVKATDPTTLVASAVVLTTVVVIAAALPAWQAARLDPLEALREE
jgi:predicted lysophospholipase L1 biosynthesis ABC-type transport system permease subunit